MEKKRIRDFGIVPGRVKTGKRNTITDVPGVLVGHCTVNTEENHTGVFLRFLLLRFRMIPAIIEPIPISITTPTVQINTIRL